MISIMEVYSIAEPTPNKTWSTKVLEMNRQISDLTSIVLALTEKITSTNREGNGLLTASNAHETRSDR